MLRFSGIVFALTFLISAAQAQTNTVGVIERASGIAEGYVLFSPTASTETYLIDTEGRLVHSWSSEYTPGQATYLLETGELLRTAHPPGETRFNAGGTGGMVQRYDWDGTKNWEYAYNTDTYWQHHDIEPLPNGNVLILAWEYKTADEAIAVGRDPERTPPTGLWPDHIIEVRPEGATGGSIVWEWHAWDHLIQDFDDTKPNYGDPSEHPERIDINAGGRNVIEDWMHTNSVKYNPELDQIILSIHNFNEIWIIDHSTTTEEARGSTGGNAGMGGDLLYRWGNPEMYGLGARPDKKLFGQHDAQWIADGLPGAGNILVYNNGLHRGPAGTYSTIDELVPPLEPGGTYTFEPGTPFAPEAPVWQFGSASLPDFYSQNISGMQRLANGNTIICEGASGVFWEVTPAKEIVWRYINPASKGGIIPQGDTPPQGENSVFKIRKYAPDYAAFPGRDLTPGDPIEGYATAVERPASAAPEGIAIRSITPNPFATEVTVAVDVASAQTMSVAVYDALGRLCARLYDGEAAPGTLTLSWSGAALPPGMYMLRVTGERGVVTRHVVKVR